MTLPLDDVTIVEIDNWMAAPSAGAILADLGARVIKVEPLTGDPMRNMGRRPKVAEELRGYDYQFDVDNRGKQSVAIDLAATEGQAVIHRLVQSADVFLCNLLPRRQQKFQLDPDTLLGLNAKLVHATLTGYGTNGPDAERPGYDVTAFFGRSGLYDAMREGEDGVVPMARTAQGDHTTGLALTTAILAGLRQAEKHGRGQVLETSLYETAVWTQASDYAITAVDRAPLRPRARENLVIATANRYPCKDGKWVVINMPQPSAWPLWCRALGKEEWLDDERLQDVRGRFDHMPELVAATDEVMATRTRDEWGKIFDKAGVIWGPVLGLHEVANDAQAEAINLFPELHHEHLGAYRTVRAPMRFRDHPVLPRAPAPALGADTVAILREAGYDDAEVQALTEAGTVSTGDQAVER